MVPNTFVEVDINPSDDKKKSRTRISLDKLLVPIWFPNRIKRNLMGKEKKVDGI